MRKFIAIFLLAVIWKVYVYSGDSGRLVYTSREMPKFSHEGRWVHFKDEDGDERWISGSSTIIIREIKE